MNLQVSPRIPNSVSGSAACLLLCLGLASCASSPSTQPMPDGKRWTGVNLNLSVPESYCYDDQPAHCERYGRLYTWAAAQTVCARLGSAWRLPSMDDWKQLARAFGGVSGDGADNGKAAYRELLAGGKSGLGMLLGGGRDGERKYARMEAHGFYWSTTEESATNARLLNFGKGSGAVFDQHGGDKTRAYSVRCVAD